MDTPSRASDEGNDITPLELLLAAMRQAWERNDLDEAVQLAIEAAPYCHPKLQKVEHMADTEPAHETAAAPALIRRRTQH